MPMPRSRSTRTAIRLRASLAHLARQLRTQSGPDEPAKFGVLGPLYRVGALTPTQLAQRERVKLQTLTRLLAEPESEKLVRRRPHPRDARQTLLSLTASGTGVLKADIQRRDASLAAAIGMRLAAVDEAVLDTACSVIDRLGDALADVTSRRTDARAGAKTRPTSVAAMR